MTVDNQVQKQKKDDMHPSGDNRYKAIDLTMRRFKYEKDSLLEVLNTAQETFGFLSEDLLMYISNHLGVPLSQIFGVATFYHMFSFKPLGKHNCVVCTGTACHVKGSNHVIAAIGEKYAIEDGETTPDGEFSLRSARCIGSCGLAPVMVIDGAVIGKITTDTALESVNSALAAE